MNERTLLDNLMHVFGSCPPLYDDVDPNVAKRPN